MSSFRDTPMPGTGLWKLARDLERGDLIYLDAERTEPVCVRHVEFDERGACVWWAPVDGPRWRRAGCLWVHELIPFALANEGVVSSRGVSVVTRGVPWIVGAIGVAVVTGVVGAPMSGGASLLISVCMLIAAVRIAAGSR